MEFAEGRFGIIHDGEEVGWVRLQLDEAAQEAWFTRIKVDEAGHHYGLATYRNVIKTALEHGYNFRNDPKGMSGAGAHVWLKLADLGIARVIEGFRQPRRERTDGMVGTATGERSGIQGRFIIEGHAGTPLPEGYSFADPEKIRLRERAELMRRLDKNTNSVKLREVDRYLRARKLGIMDVGVRDGDGRLAGFGRIIHKGERGELSDLLVDPEHQHQGIGRAIVSERLRLAEAAGLTSLYMPYLQKTNSLRPYYRQKGFRETHEGEVVRGPNPDSVIGRHLMRSRI